MIRQRKRVWERREELVWERLREGNVEVLERADAGRLRDR